MRIARLSLENFRQFYGPQELELACDPKRNVTLIHAENGVGKTTLLNAILWALYGKTTPRFEQKDRIVNFGAFAERKRVATVQVEFEHAEARYRAVRTITAKDSGSSINFAAYKIEGGVSHPLNAAEAFINSVIPDEMARYFFFDGEAAESFSSENNSKAVGAAIRAILGCDLAETAIADLRAVARDFESLVRDIPGAEDLQKTERQLEDARAQLEKVEAVRERLEADVADLRVHHETILQQLRGAEAAKEIQATRDEKTLHLATVNEDIRKLDSDLLKWIGTRSLLLLGRRLSSETLDFIDEQALRGRIPSPYNEEFVRGILDARSCVCGRTVEPQTHEWECVASLLRDAANAEILGRIVRARSRSAMFREGALAARGELEENKARRSDLEISRRRLEQELDHISEKIKGLPIQEIAEREAARREISQKIEKRSSQIGELRQTAQRWTLQINAFEREMRTLASKSQKARHLMQRIDLCERGASVLADVLSTYQDEAREKIQETVNGVLAEVARRHYRCALDADFGLSLLYSDGRHTPKSSGENQLLSLAFMSSLIKFAIDRATAKTSHLLVPGAVAPLVLDSPFGQLDKDYRKSTATFVSSLADQVVLLVSSSQGDEDVVSAIRERVGAEYILVSENRGPRDKKGEDRILLNGREYVRSLFNQPRDMSRIERVS